MKQIIIILTASILLPACKSKQPETLKSVLQDKFLIGTALNLEQIYQRDTLANSVILEHFSSIVPENCMKSMFLQPKEGEFFFDDADKYVEYGEKHNLWIVGHCLVWHSQTPDWFFVDSTGKEVTRQVLLSRIKNHITTVVSRYKGRVNGWDVVNEAILEDGSWRQSPLYRIIGESFIDSAFVWANRADTNAELYYNDYNMADCGKRNEVVKLVKHLKDNNIRIDAVGMQAHVHLDYPSIYEFEKSIEAFAAAGVKVMITELDMSILPRAKYNVGADISTDFEYQKELNPYVDGVPAEKDSIWTSRFLDFFDLFLKHSNTITRVTTWGVGDADSWLNNWPIPGRTDYPLLFDRNYMPKPCIDSIISKI